MPMSQFFKNFLDLDDPLKKHEETVDRKRAHKRSTRLTKMLRSTAAASVLEFDQTLSLSGFAWHALLVLSNLRYLNISLVLLRSPDITMHNGNQSQIHTHIHTCNKKTTHRASS